MFILRFLVKVAINAGALWFSAYLLSGFHILSHTFSAGLNILLYYQTLVVAGFVLAVLNTILRPVLKIISFPLVIISFGLFNIIINAIILWVLAWLIPEISIDGLTAWVGSTLIVGIINTVL
ncbi:MAG: phage holin family protein [Candidatus Sungbacteria bacterium]|uniref:Phage holin family protein n=1 Tax=Candidatus Sungiibacteriota bacterium TaxID=2750080 RepID=A0A9D6LPJ8_9BACT|nr:phage holin family protein [Candidatus Sungbacteria bacterium]